MGLAFNDYKLKNIKVLLEIEVGKIYSNNY